MATTVVSGRVDEHIKREVDHIIERAGKTPGDVIRAVWTSIYETGKLPDINTQEETFRKKRKAFQEFMAFVDSLPPAPEELLTMDWKELRDMMCDDMIAEYNAL